MRAVATGADKPSKELLQDAAADASTALQAKAQELASYAQVWGWGGPGAHPPWRASGTRAVQTDGFELSQPAKPEAHSAACPPGCVLGSTLPTRAWPGWPQPPACPHPPRRPPASPPQAKWEASDNKPGLVAAGGVGLVGLYLLSGLVNT